MKARDVVDGIERSVGISGPPEPLVSAIEKILVDTMPPIQAAERAERLVAAVSRIIADKASLHERGGTVAILSLVGSDSAMVCGSSHVFPHDDPNVAGVKQNRPYTDDLLQAMRSLTFSEFELFSAAVLRELGVTKPHITKHSNDQGIDFYGFFSIGQLQSAPAPFFKLSHDIVFAFAGQAKHYPTSSLGPSVVRELVGAISLARTRTFSRDDIELFEDGGVKPFSPLLALLFTTGEITSGARQLAEAAGIIARSGVQLAVYLADRGVGIVAADSGKSFSKAKFDEWLGK